MQTTIIDNRTDRTSRGKNIEKFKEPQEASSPNDNSEQMKYDLFLHDLMTVHNYEMPTKASMLKQTTRSYFHRYNFRNIPFVVGTSITPSHNLGMNIQQVIDE